MALGTFFEQAKGEFFRSPIATTVTIFGALSGLGAFLLIPWLKIPEVVYPGDGRSSLAYMFASLTSLGVAVSFACVSNFVYRKAKLASFIVSVLLASLSILFVSLLVSNVGVGFPIGTPSKEATDRLIFWVHVFVFVSINGEPILKSVVATSYNPEDDRADVGVFAVLALGMLLWGGLLAQSQVLLLGENLAANAEMSQE
ncbi:hypothetical protein MWU38_00225 [Qipengyuania sp. S6317L1]|uniref:hypothetical protein n=1 Tax=Qipengyuania sp. S6317L1 TaxID=2926410 RepID=UPI001FF35E5B|nr:hypothetical protein [Qipengyuania sp. S6317L1]MCK0097795.1 hypothetical protein [Qipengyuania sp. S6317L1]